MTQNLMQKKTYFNAGEVISHLPGTARGLFHDNPHP